MSRMRRLSGLALAAALGAGVAGGAAAVAGPGQDVAHGGGEPANLGQVKLDVQDYYGDWVDDEGKHHHSQEIGRASRRERVTRAVGRDRTGNQSDTVGGDARSHGCA